MAAGTYLCPHCYESEHPEEGWICNSSICMKRRGFKPTGIAIYDAQQRGFKSVGHWLQAQLRKRGGVAAAQAEAAEEVAAPVAAVVAEPAGRTRRAAAAATAAAAAEAAVLPLSREGSAEPSASAAPTTPGVPPKRATRSRRSSPTANKENAAAAQALTSPTAAVAKSAKGKGGVMSAKRPLFEAEGTKGEPAARRATRGPVRQLRSAGVH